MNISPWTTCKELEFLLQVGVVTELWWSRGICSKTQVDCTIKLLLLALSHQVWWFHGQSVSLCSDIFWRLENLPLVYIGNVVWLFGTCKKWFLPQVAGVTSGSKWKPRMVCQKQRVSRIVLTILKPLGDIFSLYRWNKWRSLTAENRRFR